jgi:hypothetical protein
VACGESMMDKWMICLRFEITRRIKEGLVGPFGHLEPSNTNRQRRSETRC